MRLHLKLSSTKEKVPYNYRDVLVSNLHNLLGEDNPYHNNVSLYTFSSLMGGDGFKTHLEFRNGAEINLSAYDKNFMVSFMKGLNKNPELGFGFSVDSIKVEHAPEFKTNENRFFLQSPALIKYNDGGSKFSTYYTYKDIRANGLLTDKLKYKLRNVGLDCEGVEVSFNRKYPFPKERLIKYKNTHLKTSACPVIIKGSQEQLAFAWEVGIGSSTGLGLGSITLI